MSDGIRESSPSVVALLRRRAEEQPERVAYVFLKDGTIPDVTLTWADVDRQARSVAGALQEQASEGDRALLLYPAGLDFVIAFYACLYAGIAAVPLYAASGERGRGRLQSVVDDCSPALLLTTEADLGKAQEQLPPGACVCLATTAVPPEAGAGWREPRIDGETLAHLQYTSGATAVPKGVMVNHRNLLHNVMDMDTGWKHTEESSLVTWLPTFHDMGLVYGVLGPLYAGITCYMMAPVSFIQRPVRWLQAISEFQATHSVAPNFAYDLCVRKVKPEDRASLDLSSWAVAVNGAEPIRQQTLENFAETFAESGFRHEALCPGFGLAEATLKVTASNIGVEPVYLTAEAGALEQKRVVESSGGEGSRPLVGCGQVPPYTTVAIVDPETLQRCAPDEIGEIWVSNESVAVGYWNRPEESEAVFRARPAGEAGGPTFLRTGDLGFLQDGELFVAGRIKDLIIIRGQNYYPQDLELTAEESHVSAESHGCAAFSVDTTGDERLVIVQEVDRHLGEDEHDDVIESIRQAIAEEHEVGAYDVVLVKPRALPRTSSGKIKRNATRQAYLEETLSRPVARALTGDRP